MLLTATNRSGIHGRDRRYQLSAGNDFFSLIQYPTTKAVSFLQATRSQSSEPFFPQSYLLLPQSDMWGFADMIVRVISDADLYQEKHPAASGIISYETGPQYTLAVRNIHQQLFLEMDGPALHRLDKHATTLLVPLAVWQQVHGDYRHVTTKPIDQLHAWEREIDYRPLNRLEINSLYDHGTLQQTLLQPRAVQ